MFELECATVYEVQWTICICKANGQVIRYERWERTRITTRTPRWNVRCRHVVRPVFDLSQDKVRTPLYFHLVDTVQECNPPTRIERRKSMSIIPSLRLTLCGAWRSLWTLLNWLLSTAEVRNVKDGGRKGSGRVMLANGSASSKYWTRHCKAADGECSSPLCLPFVNEDEEWPNIVLMFRWCSGRVTLSSRREKKPCLVCRLYLLTCEWGELFCYQASRRKDTCQAAFWSSTESFGRK